MPSPIIVPGPKVLLVGGSGTGKTHSLRTIINSGLKVFVLFSEPGQEVIADIPCASGMHWAYIAPAAPDWATMLDVANKINMLSYEMLSKQRDMHKRKFDEFIRWITSMSNLKCDRCGQAFGPADELDGDWCIANDSLSGLSMMAMNLVAGASPVKAQPDYGVAMGNLESYLTKFTTDIKCMAVMMSHLEREGDELTGGMKLMASTIGRKLAPKVPRFFSEVIMTERNGKSYVWNTMAMNVDLKVRSMPLGENLPPDFRPIIEAWRKKNVRPAA